MACDVLQLFVIQSISVHVSVLLFPNFPSGVSNCYVFKSRLQEYAQKVGFPTPVYETTKEGPSHEPSFKSTVTLNNTSYDSLPGFFNRKAAEQSAAEVALLELAKTGELNQSISGPVVSMMSLKVKMLYFLLAVIGFSFAFWGQSLSSLFCFNVLMTKRG